MPTCTVTNATRAPRIIFLESGATARIEPGASTDCDLTDAQIESERVAGMTVETGALAKPAPAATDELDTLSDENLRDLIDHATGEKPHHRTSRAKLLDAARAV